MIAICDRLGTLEYERRMVKIRVGTIYYGTMVSSLEERDQETMTSVMFKSMLTVGIFPLQ